MFEEHIAILQKLAYEREQNVKEKEELQELIKTYHWLEDKAQVLTEREAKVSERELSLDQKESEYTLHTQE